ncbi:GNAT family N-acetyltransferase [Vibrio sp. JPW-9-11-11]|uniref:GNAT family N-acetyltransferase n=1 Tax=Vibrio sp. JPW-9-11-11 TaxID=1416532 RepID=UPI001593BB28|nr:GNAT family N-acetyltransferase [Vibrio sp. JPW-9-11-11]NVD07700.1 GNAT family N-acetyltransferase [Vibrio sp. JPW-9-11-11]
MEISLRPAVESDIDFLVALRDATMREYLEQVGMPTTLEDYLNRIEYKFDCAEIVLLDHLPVGLFKAEYQPEKRCWYLIQIQIHPGYQNLKIGTQLIERLIARTEQQGTTLALSVIKTNPAYHLYQKLGFSKVAENQSEYLLERSPRR